MSTTQPRMYLEKASSGLTNDRAVDFVDVILVGEQLVGAGHCGGELRGALGLAPVVFVGDEPAFKRDEQRRRC